MKIIFIFIFLFIYVNNFIILPFTQLNQNLEYLINNNDITNITSANPILNLYSTIFLGNTPFKLLLKLYPYNNYFSFSAITQIDYNYTNYTFYNPFISKSLHVNKNINFNEEFREVTDVFYFMSYEGDINNIYKERKNLDFKLNNFKPYLYLNCFVSNWYFSSNYTGILGLGRSSSNYPNNNFIKELKVKSVINNSIWIVEFDKDSNDNIDYDKGKLIIGEYPHVYNPNKYNSENYYKLKLFNDYFNLKYNNEWVIQVDNSYIIKEGEVRTSSNYINFIDIMFGLYTMQAPYFLFEQLKFLFFEKYFDKKICKFKKLIKDNDEKIYIFCTKKFFDENEQKLFHKIIFNITNSSDIIQFELNSKDVFITKNDIVYFMINFSLKDDRQDMIKVGLIFLNKYKLVFDYDNDEIGIYIDFLKNNDKSNKIFVLTFTILFLCCFCFTFFGYKKGLWCVEKNKSRKIK